MRTTSQEPSVPTIFRSLEDVLRTEGVSRATKSQLSKVEPPSGLAGAEQRLGSPPPGTVLP